MEKIRVVRLEAEPTPQSPEFSEVAGAFVNVYTTAPSDSEALRIASAEIAEAGWLILCVEEQFLLSRAEAQDSPDALPYFEQALIDGVVLVFHNYLHGGEEPSVVH